MPILSEDVKLLASERLTDNPDGGGRVTGNEVTDGQSNNLFPDISELDRTYGRVNLRKAFVGIHTDDTDMYYGGHIIVQEPPEDPLVDVTLFTTNSATDEREDARQRIESYVVKGPVSRLRLLEDQLPGQRAIICYQDVGAPLPQIGEVLCLSEEDNGGNVEYEQYVRVTAVEVETRTFVDTLQGTTQTEFDKDVLTISIGSELRYRFSGGPARRFTRLEDDEARVRETNVANASKYYGTRSLAATAEMGDATLQLDSIFGALVPSAQAETSITDAPVAGDMNMIVPAGPERTVNISTGSNWNAPTFVSGPIAPSTLTVQAGSETFTDLNGNLLNAAGNVIGDVDYETGQITPHGSHPSGNLFITYQPGAVVSAVTHTAQYGVNLGDRGYIYNATLTPIPTPGYLAIDFRSQGRWYRLRDNGRGELAGEIEGTGTGRIDYTTGTVTVTLGALPDVGSAILFFWGTRSDYHQATGEVELDFALHHTLEKPPAPGAVTVTWQDGANERTATDDGSGNFTGDATGRIIYATGELVLVPNSIPPAGTVFSFEHDELTARNESLEGQDGTVTITLDNAPIRPGTLELRIPGRVTDVDVEENYTLVTPVIGRTRTLIVRDDGNGNLIGDCKPGGTINYATGEVIVEPYYTETTELTCKRT